MDSLQQSVWTSDPPQITEQRRSYTQVNDSAWVEENTESRPRKRRVCPWSSLIRGLVVGILLGGIVLAIVITLWLTSASTTSARPSSTTTSISTSSASTTSTTSLSTTTASTASTSTSTTSTSTTSSSTSTVSTATTSTSTTSVTTTSTSTSTTSTTSTASTSTTSTSATSVTTTSTSTSSTSTTSTSTTSTSTSTSSTSTTSTSTTSVTTTSTSTSTTSTVSTSTTSTASTTTSATAVAPCAPQARSSGPLFSVTNPTSTTYPSYVCYAYTWVATGLSAALAFFFRHDPGGWMVDEIQVYHGLTQLIVNGGFESGSLSGWNYSGTCSVYIGTAYSGSSYAKAGSYYYYDRCSQNGDTISQSFVTVPGDTYVISFWMTNYSCCSTTEIANITIT